MKTTKNRTLIKFVLRHKRDACASGANGDNFTHNGNNLPINLRNNLQSSDSISLYNYGGCGHNIVYKAKWSYVQSHVGNINFSDSTKVSKGKLVHCKDAIKKTDAINFNIIIVL